MTISQIFDGLVFFGKFLYQTVIFNGLTQRFRKGLFSVRSAKP